MTTPKRFIWTREKYEYATTLGVLGTDDHIELIKGELICKARQNSLCSTAQCLTGEVLHRLFDEGFDVRGQQPLTLDDESQPEPDVAVVRGVTRDFSSAHPTAQVAVLVVEISDTTLGYERFTKAAAYAESRVPEYWIVNLKDRLLEVHRQPAPISGHLFGHGSLEIQRLTETDTVIPLVAKNAVIAVADLLP